MTINVQQVTGTSVNVTEGAANTVNTQSFVPAAIAGYIVLTGLGNSETDYQTIQDAIDESAAYYAATGRKKYVYIPANEHGKISDMLIAKDHAGLIVDGILENVTTSETYNGQGRLFQIGRIAQSDFEPTPNNLGVVQGSSGNRITFKSVTDASWFALYNSAGGRAFKLSGSTEGNPAAEGAFIKAAGNDGSNYYIDLEDSAGADIDADVLEDDVIFAMDTIGESTGFLNQIGTNVFNCQTAYRGKVITLESGGDNFSVGEKVYLKGAGYYIVRFNSDRAFTPYYAHADVIEAIDGDEITLQVGLHDLGEAVTDLQLCKFTNLRTIISQHPSGGISPGVVNDFYVGGKGLFKMNINAGICNASNFINSTFNIEGKIEAGGFVTNGMTASTFYCRSMKTEGVGISIAQGAADFSVEVDLIDGVKATGEGSSKTARSFIFPHENCINGNIKIGHIRISQDYPLALNMLQMDCRDCVIEFGYEIQKRQLTETASFGLNVKVRSQDPQLLGLARGYHGGNTVIQNYGLAPYLSSVLQLDDQTGSYEDRGDVYNLRNIDAACGEVVDIGANRSGNDIQIDVIRRIRELSVTDFESDGSQTVVTCVGDIRVFADGQSVKFSDIEDDEWEVLNDGTYNVASLSGQTVTIDFDSSGLPAFALEGSPVMQGAESAVYLSEDAESFGNTIRGYVKNEVDTSVGTSILSLAGANTRSIEDEKYRRVKGIIERLNVQNSGNSDTDGNYEARGQNGYFCTHAGKTYVEDGNTFYPTLNRLGRIVYARFISTAALLVLDPNTLKVGDTFVKKVRAHIYGSSTDNKTFLDTYRWIELNVAEGTQSFEFTTAVNGGQEIYFETRFSLNDANYLDASAYFYDGTEARESVGKRIRTPSTQLRNHLISYYASGFNPTGGAYSSTSDFAAYEATFEGEDIQGDTKERIVIESVTWEYERLKTS